MAALHDFLRACDSWRRFHLRNWFPITTAMVGAFGSSLVVIATLGIVAAIGSWILMAAATMAGLTNGGRI